MSVIKRNGAFSIYFRPFRDKKIGLKLDTTSKNEAGQIEAMILRACRSGNYTVLDDVSREACVRMFRNQKWEFPSGLADDLIPQRELTLWDAVMLCMKYPEVQNSPNRDRMEQAFVHIGERLGRNLPVKHLWIPQITQYQLERQSEGAAASTINKESAALSRMFQVLIELRYLDVNPARLVKRLSEKNAKRQMYISLADFQNILKLLPGWYKPIAQVAFYTGMRRGEILGLTWKRVNIKNRMIYLGPDDVTEKNWKRVPIHHELVPILEDIRSQNVISMDRIFIHNGVPVAHRDQVRWAWDRNVENVEGLEPLPHFHDLRHTWKTNARRSGMDPEIRESIMGHALRGKSVSEGYGRISNEELIQAIDNMTFDHGATEIWVAPKKEKPTGTNCRKKKGNFVVTSAPILQGQKL
jgi:integrase